MLAKDNVSLDMLQVDTINPIGGYIWFADRIFEGRTACNTNLVFTARLAGYENLEMRCKYHLAHTAYSGYQWYERESTIESYKIYATKVGRLRKTRRVRFRPVPYFSRLCRFIEKHGIVKVSEIL